jgi:hypothetical protein
MGIEQPTTLEKKPGPDTPTNPVTNGLKIDTTLFCLDTGSAKYLFTTEDAAIDYLKKLDKKDINPDNSQITQVLATGNTWKLTPIPWSRIAIKLL